MNILIEHLAPNVAKLTEQRVGENLFLDGIFLQAKVKNGNQRTYALEEISRVVNDTSKRIAEGHIICGELDHPAGLSINLSNVSHAITQFRMDGNNAVGKMKILNTPAGNIARGLIDGGVRLGVSSRGAGNVNESGEVTAFQFITCDIVASPSAPDAYPNVVREAMENNKIMSLAEAMVHDKKAQDFLKKELSEFIKTLMRK